MALIYTLLSAINVRVEHDRISNGPGTSRWMDVLRLAGENVNGPRT